MKFLVVSLLLFTSLVVGCASKLKSPTVESSAPILVGDPWFRAARTSDIATLNRMIQGGSKIDAATESGTTALMVAARSGNLETVKWLIANGAVASVVDRDNQSALAYALLGGTEGIKLTLLVQELLRAGANPLLIDRFGFQPVQEMLELDMDDLIRKIQFSEKKPCDLLLTKKDEAPISKAARRLGKTALAEFLEAQGCW